MFETVADSEVPLPDFSRDKNHRYWQYVKTSSHSFWFYLVTTDNSLISDIYFVRDVPSLCNFISSESINIIEIYIAYRDLENNGGAWKMELLKEIYLANEPGLDYEQDAHIFVLKDNIRYVDSAIDTQEKDLENKTLIYQI